MTAEFYMSDCILICIRYCLKFLLKFLLLNNDGRSVRYIAQHLNIARSTVQDTLSRFRKTHKFSRRPGSGRRRSTNARDDRFLHLSVLRDRGLPANILAGRLAAARGVTISEQTVRRRLREGGLSSRSPATGPRLTAAHRRARLEFALQYVDWGVNEWRSLLFTDESRFSPRSPDGRENVWRRPGQRYSQCCMSPRTGFNGGSIMVWGGISLDACTDLVFVENGAMTTQKYILECLEPHVVPYAPFIGENFLLMDDNARPHRARIVDQYLEQVSVQRFPWPACSPDLNPIELVSDFLSRRVRRRQPDQRT
jgi:transposase